MTIKQKILKEIPLLIPYKESLLDIGLYWQLTEEVSQAIDRVEEETRKERKSKFMIELNKIKDIADGCIYVGKENVAKLEVIREVVNRYTVKDHNLSVNSNK